MLNRRGFLGAAAVVCATMGRAFADGYPNKPIELIVPYTPGGTPDLLARALGPELTKAWGQPIIVDNRPGAGGNVGAEVVAKATPDGYTLLLCANAPFTTNLALYGSLAYDPAKDFKPIAAIGFNSPLIVASSSSPFTSLQKLIEMAKAKPGSIRAGTSGNGTSGHLFLSELNRVAGIEIVHVPYRGAIPSLTAVLQGEVEIAVGDPLPAFPYMKSSQMRGLAMSGKVRSHLMPDVPTLAEAGLPGLTLLVWTALAAPAGIPDDIAGKINAEINRLLKTEAFQRELDKTGLEAPRIPNGVAEFGAFVKEDTPRWQDIVIHAGVKLD